VGGGRVSNPLYLANYIISDDYLITSHAKLRMTERGITNASLENGIIEGEIIEEYSNDMPCPTVLLLSMVNNIPLHIVIGLCTDHIRIITCYYPEEKEWIDYRIRRAL